MQNTVYEQLASFQFSCGVFPLFYVTNGMCANHIKQNTTFLIGLVCTKIQEEIVCIAKDRDRTWKIDSWLSYPQADGRYCPLRFGSGFTSLPIWEPFTSYTGEWTWDLPFVKPYLLSALKHTLAQTASHLLTSLHCFFDHHSAVRIDHVSLGRQVRSAVIVGQSNPKKGRHGRLCVKQKGDAIGQLLKMLFGALSAHQQKPSS